MRFLRVAYAVYEGDPNWVAPLLMDLRKVFTEANPLFAHATMQLWVAVRDGRDVGRIAGVVDRHFIETQHNPAAFFGFFESVQDPAIAARLLGTVCDWARSQGLGWVLGPMNPTSNDECGLLVDGFDVPPVLMMTYNPRYYPGLLEAAGFRKAKDMIAFHIDLAKTPMERLGRIAAKTKQRWPELRFRPIRRKTLTQDLGRIKAVYNEAWEDNWGFVPMTDAEVDFLAARLKPLLTEGITWLAEADNEPVGFLLALPDFNVPFQPLRGRVLTPRALGLLPYLLGWKCPPRSRVLALGVKRAYRGKGLEAVMLFEGLQAGFNAGFVEAEASWILEDNLRMRRVLEIFGAVPYKTYRLYERELLRVAAGRSARPQADAADSDHAGS